MQSFKGLVVLASLLCAASAGRVSKSGNRQFLPSDITGDYSRFVLQGSCSNKISFKSYTSVTGDVYTVSHPEIAEDGYPCTSDGTFTLLTEEAITKSANAAVLETPPLGKVVTALREQGATFMVGFETIKRVCGPRETAKNSVMVFIDEEREINIPGLINLYPGAKYMIVYEPTSPTPCTYFSKLDEREVGIAITPAPGAGPFVVGGPAGDGEITAEASAEPGEAEPLESPEIENDAGLRPVQGGSAPIGTGASTTGTANGEAFPEASSEEGAREVDPTPSGPLTTGGTDEFGQGTEASPEASSEEDDGGSVCFPGDATVEREDGSVVRMSDIRIGDRVKVGSGKFSPVFMFSHKLSDVAYNFVKLSTASGKTVRLTSGHYLYVNGRLAAARSVNVGDALDVDGAPDAVVAVDRVAGTGLFNPQTESGDIVVDGVTAGCYTTSVKTSTAHSLLLPLRAMFRTTGIATSWLDSGADSLAEMVPSGNLVA